MTDITDRVARTVIPIFTHSSRSTASAKPLQQQQLLGSFPDGVIDLPLHIHRGRYSALRPFCEFPRGVDVAAGGARGAIGGNAFRVLRGPSPHNHVRLVRELARNVVRSVYV